MDKTKWCNKPMCLLLSLALVLSLGAAVLTPAGTVEGNTDWWNNNWQYRMKLTFNNTASAENLTNFPVLVNLTSTHVDFWTHINSVITTDDTKDLRFVDADDSTELYFEAESINYTGKDALIWVKVPLIDAGSTTDFIYVYYGNPAATESVYHSASDVWNPFVMVQHMNDDPNDSTITGSTSNHHEGTKKAAGEPAEADGKIGKGQDFDEDYIEVPNDSSFNHGYVTVEAWVKADAYSTGWHSLINRKQYPLVAEWDGTTFYFRINAQTNAASLGNWTADQWYYLALRYDGSTIKIYRNGKEAASANYSRTMTTSNNGYGLGTWDKTSEYFDGIVDEVRISNPTRSADWIYAQYLSMTDDFITYGGEEKQPARPPSPPTVPTVNHWGIVAMMTLFAGLLVWTVRRRRLAL